MEEGRGEGSSDSRKFLINTHGTTYKTKANLSPLGLAMNELRTRKVEMEGKGRDGKYNISNFRGVITKRGGGEEGGIVLCTPSICNKKKIISR